MVLIFFFHYYYYYYVLYISVNLFCIKCSGENPDDPRVPVQRCHSSPEMSEGAVVGGNEVMQQAVDEEDPQTTTSTPPQAVPSDTEHVSAVAKPVKPKPRYLSFISEVDGIIERLVRQCAHLLLSMEFVV